LMGAACEAGTRVRPFEAVGCFAAVAAVFFDPSALSPPNVSMGTSYALDMVMRLALGGGPNPALGFRSMFDPIKSFSLPSRLVPPPRLRRNPALALAMASLSAAKVTLPAPPAEPPMEPGGDRNEAAVPAAPTPDALAPPPPLLARVRPGVLPPFRSRGLETPGVDEALVAVLVGLLAAPPEPSPPPTGNPPGAAAGVAGVLLVAGVVGVGAGAGAGVPPPNVGADEGKENDTPFLAVDAAAAAAVVLPGVWTPGVVAAAAGAVPVADAGGAEEPKAGAGEPKLKDISTSTLSLLLDIPFRLYEYSRDAALT